MNRIISVVVSLVVAFLGTAVAGYWNSHAVVPLGDARLPGWIVGVWIVGNVGLVSALFGGKIGWASLVSSMTAKVVTNSQVNTAVVVKDFTSDQRTVVPFVTRESVAAIPVQVEHLLGCVYHLRVALKADSEGQELLDQIQIKIGRVSAQISSNTQKDSGGA